MKNQLILIFIIAILLSSCQTNQETGNNKESTTTSINQVTNFEPKTYNQNDFLETYADSYPALSNMYDYIEMIGDNITVINDTDTELTYSFSVDYTYEEAIENIEAFDWSVHEAFNTSLSGTFDMSDEGAINYHIFIIENDDFTLNIAYLNDGDEFKKACGVEAIKNIGEDNLVVEIIKHNN